MNKSLSYVNLGLELHVASTFWLGSGTSGTFSVHLFCPAIYELERPAWENGHTLVQRTEIFSWKFSVKVFLKLGNPFQVPSGCKLNHISLCFIQASTKSPAKLLIPFRESTVFFVVEIIAVVLGCSVNFKITEISIKTASVCRLSVTLDYSYNYILRTIHSETSEV